MELRSLFLAIPLLLVLSYFSFSTVSADEYELQDIITDPQARTLRALRFPIPRIPIRPRPRPIRPRPRPRPRPNNPRRPRPPFWFNPRLPRSTPYDATQYYDMFLHGNQAVTPMDIPLDSFYTHHPNRWEWNH